MSNRTRRFAMISGAVLGGALLVGAAAPAMAAENLSTPAPVADKAVPAYSSTDDGRLQVFQGRVAITITNETAQAVTVNATGYSISDKVSKTLQPGDSVRVAGHALSGNDVVGTMTYADGSKVSFWGYNPEFGYPSIGFGDGSNWDRYYVDEQIDKSENGHDFTVKRHGDLDLGGGKDFRIAIKS